MKAAWKKSISRGAKSPMPGKIAPMLCTLTKSPPTNPGYLFEIKWDGYRIISYINQGKVRMDSRNGKDYTARYPKVEAALKNLQHDLVLDGEVVVFNEKGQPDFDALQVYNAHQSPIAYCVFDLLWIDGYNLMELPLEDRKDLLRQLVEGHEILRFSESFDDGAALFSKAIDLNLEGIVAKKKTSAYIQNERGSAWLKIPTRIRQEFVIGGWAESEKGRSFRSLLFGAYNSNKQLEWIGRSGGGYKEKDMPGILRQLKHLEISKSPFINKVLDTKGAIIHYVKPKLVANFEFATWTKSGRIRKPATFLGMRTDKNAMDVVREIPAAGLSEGQTPEPEGPTRKKQPGTTENSNWKVLEQVKPAFTETVELEDCDIRLTEVDRSIWKNIPKARLIEYYHTISRLILPHLKDRPLSLHIKPNGATAPGLYIKDMEGRQPDCAEIFTDTRRHPKAGRRQQIDYLVCNNEATLLYMINLGCIDINPWMSRRQKPEAPDFINIDLDPSDDQFEKVIETAMAAREVLAQYKLTAFSKTSGKTGIHIYIPVTGIGFLEARDYSEWLGKQIQTLVPGISTTSVAIRSRGNKVFIDPSQNDYADTLASVYSVRPYKRPTVSTPLLWKEVKPGLDPASFTIDTIEKRIRSKGDLFQEVLDVAIARKNEKLLNKI